MGGCQNYGPFFGYPKYEVPYYIRDPNRDHNFDNHPAGLKVRWDRLPFADMNLRRGTVRAGRYQLIRLRL